VAKKQKESSYNKDDINGIKGRLGELILWLYYFVFRGIELIEATKEQQDTGIDFTLPTNNQIGVDFKIDAKLSDCMESKFSLFYHNGSGLRHPFRENNNVDKIAPIQFDWESYQNDNATDKTTEQIYERLKQYIEEENLEIIVKKMKNNKAQSLKELYIAHRTIARLQKEKDQKVSFEDFKQLFEKYVKSISLINTRKIVGLCKTIPEIEYGQCIYDKNNSSILVEKVFKGYNWKTNQPQTAVEISYDAVKNHCTFLYRKERPEIKQESVMQTDEPSFRETTIIFGKFIGRQLKDIPIKYLGWLATEAKDLKGQDKEIKQEYQYRMQNESK
jgi:hypothetical protein